MLRASIAACGLALMLSPSQTAHAGLPECGGIRLEDASRCEIKGDVECSGGCSDLGIYKKACATRLHTVCREDCTLSAMPTCTDECTGICQDRCDRGEDITCLHNCFGECVGSCDVTCEGAEDVEQCMASCEATCDGECDVKCGPVVSGSCYEHCIECCGGSCGAQANMDCQTTCQDREFEDCEYELRIDCDASCSGDGALFCDGEFVLAGSDIDECVQALLDRGIEAEAKAAIEVGKEALEDLNDSVDELRGPASVKSGGGCSVGARGAQGGLAHVAWLLLASWAVRRRRA